MDTLKIQDNVYHVQFTVEQYYALDVNFEFYIFTLMKALVIVAATDALLSAHTVATSCVVHLIRILPYCHKELLLF